jgi:glyoxylase-like metal-dependent hydrolase (beta-lactamase superfamily II)
MQLHQNIMKAGFQLSDITKVLLSHLHKDHAGGAGDEREGMGSKLSLPNARYFVQQEELRFAFEKGFPSYMTNELECLKNNSRVVLLEGKGTLDNYIDYEITGAHSPYHQVFWIRENNETIFFGGDEAPQLHQMKNRFVAKYDYDGKKAMQLRQKWWETGNKEGWSFLFYHDIKTPIYASRDANAEKGSL